MKTTRLAIPDVVLIESKVFGDARGFFFESFNQQAFNEATGTQPPFVQDTDYYAAQHERCIAWYDPQLAINWRYAGEPRLLAKGAPGLLFEEVEQFS